MSSHHCPYCSHYTPITSDTKDIDSSGLLKDNSNGPMSIVSIAYLCMNPECKKYSLRARLYRGFPRNPGELIHEWNLLPGSNMKVLPDYVPLAIRQDYEEASKIIDLSPKASATLARRALQGMIRDFWNVTDKKTLHQEIEAIKNRVDVDTWAAIDAVRRIGNIGAHMEKDVNLIIDVEPDEAALLLRLIEDLIDDWYVDKHDRQQRLEKIKQLAEGKKLERESARK